jgi:two-component system, LytTR family, response regulator AlgR
MTAGILKIAIADDEPLARLRLQQLCEDLNGDCPNQLLGSYEHGSALINAAARWGQTGTPDVLLLDINMPGLSGVEIAGYLKKHAPALAVVFVTAEPQHALAAFEVACAPSAYWRHSTKPKH